MDRCRREPECWQKIKQRERGNACDKFVREKQVAVAVQRKTISDDDNNDNNIVNDHFLGKARYPQWTQDLETS